MVFNAFCTLFDIFLIFEFLLFPHFAKTSVGILSNFSRSWFRTSTKV